MWFQLSETGEGRASVEARTKLRAGFGEICLTEPGNGVTSQEGGAAQQEGRWKVHEWQNGAHGVQKAGRPLDPAPSPPLPPTLLDWTPFSVACLCWSVLT